MTATGSEQRFPPIEATLLRIVVVFRVIGVLWLVSLATLVLLTEEPNIDPQKRTVLVLATVAVAVTWTVVTVILARRRPEVLSSPPFLVVDLALASATALVPALVRTESFFVGGYPISSAFLVAATKGMTATVLAALLVAVSSVAGVRYASARAAEVLAINLLAPVVLAWGFGLIRRHDEERRRAEGALAEERAKRARADERAEMAAHLHDSVLQTLALIQRRVPENRAVVRLARRQERELRAWLNGGLALGTGNTLNTALARAAEDVEDEHDVLVELSTAGDATIDERLSGLVLAAREAMANAARFGGVDRVFVLSEVGESGVRLVVRDQGVGFDPAEVADDRRGIRESIVGRLERLGGSASIHSELGQGTEVDLQIGSAE
jgi:signal transduction histidine kinase